MKIKSTHKVSTIRFCRWSRKAYAAFASIGKHVTIGKVCKSITEASLNKTASFHSTKSPFEEKQKAPADTSSLREWEDSFLPELERFNILKNDMLPCVPSIHKASYIIIYISSNPKSSIGNRTSYIALSFYTYCYD